MQQINHNQHNTQSKKSEKNENSEVGNIKNSATLTDIDWSMPELVFPFAVNGIMKNSNYYFETVFSGLVIAVGGMSEQIVRESSSALLKRTYNKCLIFRNYLIFNNFIVGMQ